MDKRGAVIDVVVALALTAGAQAEIWNSSDLSRRGAAAATTAALTVLVAARRRLPVACAVGAMAVLLVQQLAIGDVEHASIVAVLALAVAFYSLGAYAPPRIALLVGGAAVVEMWIIGLAKDHPIGDILFVTIILFGPWIAGMARHRSRVREHVLQQKAQELAWDGERRAQAAVEEERVRIARELHDVVAHAMSVIVLQAGAERRVLPAEMDSTREVLETIESTARQALGEMRRLVGLMRQGDEALALAPQPSLRHLPDLCEQVRTAGLDVDLTVTGNDTGIPPGVDVSAYRIVQEALTNALKHAGPARARVHVRYGTDDVEVEVVDDGRTRDATPIGSGGHGLVGMRERVLVYNGELETGSRTTGGWAVRARLPLTGG